MFSQIIRVYSNFSFIYYFFFNNKGFPLMSRKSIVNIVIIISVSNIMI